MNVPRKNSNMETYIRSYDDILDEDICQSLIDKFEQSNSQYEIHDNVAMSFTQINLMKHNDWRIFYDDLNLSFKSCIEKYKDDSTELIDWLKLLMADDIPDEILKDRDPSKAIPPLYGALIKNEQDVQLLERLAFMARREAANNPQ